MKKHILAITTSALLFTINPENSSAQSSLQQDSQVISTAKSCYNAMISGDGRGSEFACQELSRTIQYSPMGSIDRLRAQTVLSAFNAAVRGNSESATRELSIAAESVTDDSVSANAAKSEAYNALANLFMARKEMRNASEAMTKSIQSAEKLPNKKTLVESLSSLSNLKSLMGDKEQALDYAKRTVEIGEELNSSNTSNPPQIMFTAYRMLAMAYAANGMLKEAIPMSERALQYAKEMVPGVVNSRPIIWIKSDLVSLYAADGQNDKAIPLAEDLLSILQDQTIQVTKEFAIVYISLFNMYESTSETKKIEDTIDKYADHFKRMSDSPHKVRIFGMSGVFLNNNTDRKADARKHLVTATLTSNAVFGPDAKTTNEIADIAASIEITPW